MLNEKHSGNFSTLGEALEEALKREKGRAVQALTAADKFAGHITTALKPLQDARRTLEDAARTYRHAAMEGTMEEQEKALKALERVVFEFGVWLITGGRAFALTSLAERSMHACDGGSEAFKRG